MRRLLPALLSTLLVACAGGPPPGEEPPPRFADRGGPSRGGVGGREGSGGCGRLFVSPSGEPFRAPPGAPTCPLGAWFARADANGDGALTSGEFRADALRFFAVLDVDGNGLIDGAELQRYEHEVVPEMLGRGGGPPGPRAEAPARLERVAYDLQAGGGGMGGGMGGIGGGGGGRRGGGRGGETARPKAATPGGFGQGGLARFGLLDEPEPVAAADLDFDGRITRAEFSTRADQRFRTLDEAEAGRLTAADLDRRLQARGRERPPGGGSRPGGGPRGGGELGRGGRGGGGPGGPQ